MSYRSGGGQRGVGLPSSADIYGGWGGLFSRMFRGGKHHSFLLFVMEDGDASELWAILVLPASALAGGDVAINALPEAEITG